jgi:hypothetical protein
MCVVVVASDLKIAVDLEVASQDFRIGRRRWGGPAFQIQFSKNHFAIGQLLQLSTQTSYDHKTYFIRLALTSSFFKFSLPVKPAMPRPRKELDEFSLNFSSASTAASTTAATSAATLSFSWSVFVSGKLDRLLCKS